MDRLRREKPPEDSGGQRARLRKIRLVLQRVAALTVLALGGQDLAAHLLTYGAGQEAAHRVSLPVAGLLQLRQRSAAGPLE